MEYTEEFLKKIVGVGTLGYAIEKIINVLDIADKDVEAFRKDFNQPNSIVRRAYQKGIDKADYAIDMKLFDMAKNGDLKALYKYEERKEYQLSRAKK